MIINELKYIFNFIIESFLHIWPYLLLTIPLAVAVNMSGASKYINRAFSARPITAIFLATLVGAFSPFCSCGVIPVIAALLIGGVPLAPVMAFWIASPSMDPEIFFLSVATIGWELAIWRVLSTLVLSLSAGFITHFVMQQGWLGHNILRTQAVPSTQSQWALIQQGWTKIKNGAVKLFAPQTVSATASAGNVSNQITLVNDWQPAVSPVSASSGGKQTSSGCCDTEPDTSCGCGSDDANSGSSCSIKPASFKQRLFDETWTATSMVIKFMLLAFFLEALIIRFVPSEWIAALLGQQNPFSIVTAALIGVPVYTTNLTALPLISGLLAQGMSPAAALAFLIAGPTTTIPAMAAVWGLTTRPVFALYVSFSLVGAIILGTVYSLVMIL